MLEGTNPFKMDVTLISIDECTLSVLNRALYSNDSALAIDSVLGPSFLMARAAALSHLSQRLPNLKELPSTQEAAMA